MAVVKPVIFQIVGYQNSGKTTVTTKLIEALNDLGLKTVTIKHHGHNGTPDVPEEKDTTKHLKAGALASIVEGGGRMILQAEDYPGCLADQINLIQHFKADVILIEGYKFENYPKLVLLRNIMDFELLSKVSNVKMIMYWGEDLGSLLKNKSETPSFPIDHENAVSRLAQVIKHNQKND